MKYSTIKVFYHIFNLHKDEDDRQRTLETVKSNISFSGANFWILACAIMVACVGLNVNSTAVIIGAMLISPLMGPIVGAGFALGIYDFNLLKRALRNLLIATIAGLLVSTIYFYLSPFKEAQSELLARTAPNIYDVLIAFFGGLVGVIAVTRVHKGNPIPGVAIATALMPPLCTAGYGLSIGNFSFFFGSIFLYSINCVFICIATFTIVKLLRYPARQIEARYQNQVKFGITILIILMILPSVYFAYTLYNQQHFKESANKFVEREFNEKGYTLIYKKTLYASNPKTIEIALLSKRFSPEEMEGLNEKLHGYGLVNTKLIIRQDSSFDMQDLKSDILNEVKSTDTAIAGKDLRIRLLEKEISKNSFDNRQLLKEVSAIFPGIVSLSVANHSFYAIQDSSFTKTVLIYQAQKELSKQEKTKLENWLKQRLSVKMLEVYKK